MMMIMTFTLSDDDYKDYFTLYFALHDDDDDDCILRCLTMMTTYFKLPDDDCILRCLMIVFYAA